MRGRDKFKRYKVFLKAVTAILSFLPKPLLIWMWSITDLLPETLGVAFRYCLLKKLIPVCGDNVLVGRSVEIRHWEKLSIGNNVSIHKQCYLDALGGIQIENDVSIAHQTSILSFEHTWDDASLPIRDNPVRCAGIAIHSDVWVGSGCRILSGVEIFNRAVVAAGAVVTRNVLPYTVVGGVPAKAIKSILNRGTGNEGIVGS